jgi:hypothetical protein
MLPHHETERQRSVNIIWSFILGNQGFPRIGVPITEVLTLSLAKNATGRTQNMYSNIINVADCKTPNQRSLAVKYLILIMFNYPTAKTKTLYKSTDRPTGQPPDNPPNPNRLGDLHRTIPELTVRCVDHLDLQSGRGSVLTRTRTRCHGSEPLLTLHTLSTLSTPYCIISRSSVSRSQTMAQLPADLFVLNSIHSHNDKLTNQIES